MKKYLALILLLTMSCAVSSDSDLETARFALDSGDYTTAINKALTVFNNQPSNIEAAMLLAEGYAGRAGADLLNIAIDLTSNASNEDEFDAVHDALVANIGNFSDLRAAIVALGTTLSPQPSSADELFTDHQFELGMYQAIEAYGLPSITAQPTADGDITVSDITEEIKSTTQNGFINADNNLIAAGFSANDTIVLGIRETYCALQRATGSTEGFELSALRDMNSCQLSASPDSLTDFETARITTCAQFAPSNITLGASCTSADDTTL